MVQVAPVHENASGLGSAEGEYQTDERALPRARGADQRRGGAGGRVERHVFEHLPVGDVLEAHVLEADVAHHLAQWRAGAIRGVLRGEVPDLANPVQARERLRDLRTDRRDVDERQRHEADEDPVHEEVAQRHRAGENGVPALEDHENPDRPDDEGRERADARDPGHGGGDVAEQRVRPAREHEPLAPLGAVRLDDADAAERLSQPPGYVGVELAALAEQGPQPGEGVRHAAAEAAEDEDREQGEAPVQVEQHPQRDRARHQPAHQLHQAGAHQVPNALGVAHDA